MFDYSQINANRLINKCLQNIAPPENILLSEWAEKNRVLDSMSSRFVGKWSNEMTPWLIEPLNCMSPQSKYNHVVLMFGSQMGKSEAIINAILGYIDIDPGPIMWFVPTDSQAKEFSKTRIAPAIRNSKLNDFITEKSRDKDNTIMSKLFPGGSLRLSGANSSSNMAGYPVKILCRDEIDRWPQDVSGEGSGLVLTEQRTATFEDDKMIIDTSTPTIKNDSAIERMFFLTDQRRWHVPCPHCGEYQELLFSRTFEGDEKPTRMMNFIRDKSGKVKKASMICFKCGCEIEENRKTEMQLAGKYYAENPGAAIAGFFANGLNSLFMTWTEVGRRFFDSKNDAQALKSIVNLIFAETWEDPATYISPKSVQNRAENYKKVPNDVIYITCGVDVQHDRLEIEVRGWGVDFESWGIEYNVIYGSYDDPETWQQLYEYINYPIEREDGIKQKIHCTFVDSADGKTTKNVYAFCREHKANRVFAIHGRGGDNMQMIHTIKDDAKNRIRVITLGTDTIKDVCSFNLSLTEKGKNYVHFPNGSGYNKQYYSMLTAEEKVEEVNKKTNRSKRIWRLKKGVTRNEAWDVFCYNRAAIEFCIPKNYNWERVRGKIIGRTDKPIKKKSTTRKNNFGGIEV